MAHARLQRRECRPRLSGQASAGSLLTQVALAPPRPLQHVREENPAGAAQSSDVGVHAPRILQAATRGGRHLCWERRRVPIRRKRDRSGDVGKQRQGLQSACMRKPRPSTVHHTWAQAAGPASAATGLGDPRGVPASRPVVANDLPPALIGGPGHAGVQPRREARQPALRGLGGKLAAPPCLAGRSAAVAAAIARSVGWSTMEQRRAPGIRSILPRRTAVAAPHPT